MPASAKGKEIVPGMRHEWSEVYSNQFAGTSVSVVLLKLSSPLSGVPHPALMSSTQGLFF